MAGTFSRWQETRRNRRAQRVVVVGPQKKAGIGMGRDELKAKILERIERLHAELGARDRVDVYMTGSLEELGRVKERMMREAPPSMLVLIGGDGNTQKTLGEDEEFLRHLTADPEHAPEVVVIGGGTKNVVPTALGLLGDDPVRAFDVVCEKIVRGIPRDIVCCPILRINDRHGFIYGSGLVVNALDEYYAHKAGPSRALKTGLGVVWRETLGRLKPWGRRPSVFRRFDAAATWRDSGGADQPVGMDRFNAVIASSLREINPWLKVTHRTGERLGCFHGIFHNNGFYRSALNLPAMIVGAPLVGDVRDAVTDRLVIRYRAPMRHTIDGEIYTTEQLGRAGAAENGDEIVVIETGPHIKFVRS